MNQPQPPHTAPRDGTWVFISIKGKWMLARWVTRPDQLFKPPRNVWVDTLDRVVNGDIQEWHSCRHPELHDQFIHIQEQGRALRINRGLVIECKATK